MDRSESVFCGGDDGDVWENSRPLVSHPPSVRTRVPGLSLLDMPRREWWWMMKSQDNQVRRLEVEKV